MEREEREKWEKREKREEMEKREKWVERVEWEEGMAKATHSELLCINIIIEEISHFKGPPFLW